MNAFDFMTFVHTNSNQFHPCSMNKFGYWKSSKTTVLISFRLVLINFNYFVYSLTRSLQISSTSGGSYTVIHIYGWSISHAEKNNRINDTIFNDFASESHRSSLNYNCIRHQFNYENHHYVHCTYTVL